MNHNHHQHNEDDIFAQLMDDIAVGIIFLAVILAVVVCFAIAVS